MKQTSVLKLFVYTFIICLLPFGSYSNIVVLNGLTHELQVEKGKSYRGSIQIQNTAKTEKSVRVYLRDYWFSYTGESTHDPAGTLARSNAPWVSYSPELLTLQPNEKTVINFEVNVPHIDTLKGTYWSVIMVEGITSPDTANYKRGVTINTAIRYAVQVITNFGKTGKSDITFRGLELARQDDENMLNIVIENTGERVLRPEMSLEIFDDAGNSVAIIKSEQRKTFPGTSVLIQLKLEGVKPGNYTGILIADCDEDNIFGTNLSLEIS